MGANEASATADADFVAVTGREGEGFHFVGHGGCVDRGEAGFRTVSEGSAKNNNNVVLFGRADLLQRLS